MHLAQLNIGRLAAPVDDPRLAEFMDNLDRINALAEESSGFVWRLKDESNNATGIETPFPGETIANMSVWRDLESLRVYVYRSAHAPFIRKRKQFFLDMPQAHMVLWWVKEGYIPDLNEAKERLDWLEAKGPTAKAFLFSKAFDPEGRPVDRHGALKAVS